ncbi:MAG: DEAD/DEAH box helicase [Nanoarchaeota archaeon]
MNEFKEFNMSDSLQLAIQDLGFTKPTQIQAESIQDIVQGKDIIGESATGSGKTLAFGCGIVEQVIPKQGLQALVLTPTRELAEQVKDMIKDLTKELRITAVYGGVAINPQIHDLNWAEVVVATPGRLLDHMQRGTVDLKKVKILVLDEADRMLDMGFLDDVERIIHSCPRDRQTLFFSATIDRKIKELSNKHMINPRKVSAVKMVDPTKLKQVYYNVDKNMKLSLLAHLLQNEKKDLVMVFCNTRRNTEFVTKTLKLNGVNATAIHGGLSQNKRTETITRFNGAKTSVLVCTDVAARGLDIGNVSHIYNVDLPKDAKDYVHRIGRTARAGEEGIAVNLLCDYDHDNFRRIQQEYPEFDIECVERPNVKRINIPAIKNNRPRRDNNFRNRGNFRRRY